MTGKLNVQKRKVAQTSNLGSYGSDWSLNARTLTNVFNSDQYILQAESTATAGQERSRLYTQSNFDDGQHTISGTAIWELTSSGYWNTGLPPPAATSGTGLNVGISNIMISLVNNTTFGAFYRSSNVSSRFWRVKK